jgi:hypothetical protein
MIRRGQRHSTEGIARKHRAPSCGRRKFHAFTSLPSRRQWGSGAQVYPYRVLAVANPITHFASRATGELSIPIHRVVTMGRTALCISPPGSAGMGIWRGQLASGARRRGRRWARARGGPENTADEARSPRHFAHEMRNAFSHTLRALPLPVTSHPSLFPCLTPTRPNSHTSAALAASPRGADQPMTQNAVAEFTRTVFNTNQHQE